MGKIKIEYNSILELKKEGSFLRLFGVDNPLKFKGFAIHIGGSKGFLKASYLSIDVLELIQDRLERGEHPEIGFGEVDDFGNILFFNILSVPRRGFLLTLYIRGRGESMSKDYNFSFALTRAQLKLIQKGIRAQYKK